MLAASQGRSYRLPLANCDLPGTATAFSLNATVVPTTALGYLTLWPTGTAQPLVSTLNAVGDAIVAGLISNHCEERIAQSGFWSLFGTFTRREADDLGLLLHP